MKILHIECILYNNTTGLHQGVFFLSLFCGKAKIVAAQLQ